MLTIYDEPKKVKIKDILETRNRNRKYVQKFEYGDYDNWVTAIIHDIKVSISHSRLRDDDTVSLSLCYEYVSVYKADDKGYLNASYEKFEGYGNDIKLPKNKLYDVLEVEVSVQGEYIEDRFVNKE